MHSYYDPTDPTDPIGLHAARDSVRSHPNNGPVEKEPTPEQRIWAFDRVFSEHTDVPLETYIEHAEKLARWVANGKRNARMRISSPGSPNDGKEVEVLADSNAYDAVTDCFRPEYAEVRVIESGKVGGIDRQLLVDI